MGISKIGLLFAANVDSIKSRKRDTENAEQAQRRPSSGDDAAFVSSSLSKAPESDAVQEHARAEKIEQLKNQIRTGSYSVSSAKLALALARDIG